MSNRKHKLYKSLDGCCICGAKSSSSRFTSSAKYETDCDECFQLQGEKRQGEICNACVLVVKRWRKLPKDSERNWKHVVDGRSGPGVKNFIKKKEKPQTITNGLKQTGERLKYKHRYLPRKRKNSYSDRSSRSETPNFSEIHGDSSHISFLDNSYWKRQIVCCGVIYVGELGEVMLDQRHYHKCDCESQKERNISVDRTATEECNELEDNTSQRREPNCTEYTDHLSREGDEGFCDLVQL